MVTLAFENGEMCNIATYLVTIDGVWIGNWI
jgi:hypothetical protein